MRSLRLYGWQRGIAAPVSKTRQFSRLAYGLIVTFSDGTTTAYVAEELLEIRPHAGTTPKTPGSQSGPVECTLC
jgi:hypothetical protein